MAFYTNHTIGIRFDKIDRIIRVPGGEFDKICGKIKYLKKEKSGITDSINHNFGEIRIDSYNSLPNSFS